MLRRVLASARPRRLLSSTAVEGQLAHFGAGDLPFEGLSGRIGRRFTHHDVAAFAALTGDDNPLHVDREFAKTTRFGAPIVHGMLVASLFGTILGRCVRGAIYQHQELDFVRPVFVDYPDAPNAASAHVHVVAEVVATRVTPRGRPKSGGAVAGWAEVEWRTTATVCCASAPTEGVVAVSGKAVTLLPLSEAAAAALASSKSAP